MQLDYHVHTDNSLDCKTPMQEMCQHAIAAGVTEIAFTDHFNNHLLDIDLGYYNPDRFFKEIEACRTQFPTLSILAGIELGEPHRWQRRIRPVIEQYPYDLVLGSVHWVGNESVFNTQYYYARTALQAYTEYFEEVIAMIQSGGFDILAHVDLPKRVAYEIYGGYDVHAYEALIRRVWQACLEQGITPEINTKSMRMAVNQPHPAVDALGWYVEMGGTNITIGSDAHHADSLAGQFQPARLCAQAAGLTRICRFSKRQIVDHLALVQAN
jgi:histidinol-phosphatase (PHP family)